MPLSNLVSLSLALLFQLAQYNYQHQQQQLLEHQVLKSSSSYLTSQLTASHHNHHHHSSPAYGVGVPNNLNANCNANTNASNYLYNKKRSFAYELKQYNNNYNNSYYQNSDLLIGDNKGAYFTNNLKLDNKRRLLLSNLARGVSVRGASQDSVDYFYGGFSEKKPIIAMHQDEQFMEQQSKFLHRVPPPNEMPAEHHPEHRQYYTSQYQQHQLLPSSQRGEEPFEEEHHQFIASTNNNHVSISTNQLNPDGSGTGGGATSTLAGNGPRATATLSGKLFHRSHHYTQVNFIFKPSISIQFS